MLAERKKRPRSQWELRTRAMRKPELSFIPELQHEAHRRAEHKLGLQNVTSLLRHKLYRPEMHPDREGRQAAMSTAAKESLLN